MKHSALDVSKVLLFLFQDDEEGLTNLKMNKLLYFAQGCAYQRTGKPLFEDDLMAWQYGPVAPSVYSEYKQYQSGRIKYVPKSINLSSYTPEEQDIISDVAREYGKYSASKLTSMAHKPGAPWSKVYSPTEINTVIPKEDICRYFKSLNAIPRFTISYTDDDFIGYRDEDGYLVLPKEYDDET